MVTALTPPECDPERVETVARALWNALPATQCGWDGAPEEDRAVWRRLAAAAIAALSPSPAEAAVKRVEAAVREINAEARSAWRDGFDICGEIQDRDVARLRAALASPAPGCTCDRVDQPATYHFQGCPAVYPPLASPAPAPQGEEGQR